MEGILDDGVALLLGLVVEEVVLLFSVDETYALSAASAKEDGASARRVIAISVTVSAVWILATVAGALIGNALPDLSRFGLDYALPGIFIGLFGLFARTRRETLVGVACIIVGALLALAGLPLVAVLVPPIAALAAGRLLR